MAIRGTFKLTGLEEYLKKVQKAGNSIDDAVREAIKESVKPIVNDIKAGAERHRRTGDVADSIGSDMPIQSGNYIYAVIGVISDEPRAWTAVFQEYGSPTFPKDPFIRPAFDNNKNQVKSIQRKVLKKILTSFGIWSKRLIRALM